MCSIYSQLEVLIESYRSDTACTTTGLSLDIPSLREIYNELFKLPEESYTPALVNAIEVLSTDLSIGW